MIRYIAFLRGINVSGHNIIKMEVLKQYFVLPGFENIVSYIQSGNILFSTIETDETLLITIIEKKLLDSLGYPVSVIIRTITEIGIVLSNNPYLNLPETDQRSVSVTFLDRFPIQEKIDHIPLKNIEGDEITFLNREVYILHVKYGNTKYNHSFIEKNTGCKATTRNLNTLQKILTL